MQKYAPLFLALTLISTSNLNTVHAQHNQLSAEGGFGIVGQGAQRIPTGRLGYAYQIVPHLDLTFDARFSHIQTYDNYWPTQRADLTYLDGSFGLSIHPLDTDHHRIDLGLSASIRGRWERKAVRATYTGTGDDREIISINYERRTSADVGYMLRAGYSYRLSSSFRIGAHMHGYTYQEGTSLFLFGLSVDYLL